MGRVFVVTAPGVAATGAPAYVAEKVTTDGIAAAVYANRHVEPTGESLAEAVDAARDSGPWDAFVVVGGGSSIDTAKAINLSSPTPVSWWTTGTLPAADTRPFMRCVRSWPCRPRPEPGRRVRRSAVLDVLDQHVKTGISHPLLRPALAVVNPTSP